MPRTSGKSSKDWYDRLERMMPDKRFIFSSSNKISPEDSYDSSRNKMKKKRNSKIPITKANRIRIICRMGACGSKPLAAAQPVFFLNFIHTHWPRYHNDCKEDNLEFLIYSVWTLSSDRMQYATEYKQIDEKFNYLKDPKKQNISQMRSISNQNSNTNSNSNNSNSSFDRDEKDIDIESKQMNDAAIVVNEDELEQKIDLIINKRLKLLTDTISKATSKLASAANKFETKSKVQSKLTSFVSKGSQIKSVITSNLNIGSKTINIVSKTVKEFLENEGKEHCRWMYREKDKMYIVWCIADRGFGNEFSQANNWAEGWEIKESDWNNASFFTICMSAFISL